MGSSRIFLSYRRDDDPGSTQAIYFKLELELSPNQLFMDVEGKIKPGDDFWEIVRDEISVSDIVLVIIGPKWLSRLRVNPEDDADFVRLEIREALLQSKRIIPVLVGRATMPKAADLPEDIRLLSKKQALEIRPDRFNADFAGLADAVRGGEHSSPQETSAQSSQSNTIRGRSAKDGRCKFSLPAELLSDSLSKTMFAMGNDEHRQYLNGIFLHADEGLHLVATDGHRLAIVCHKGATGLRRLHPTIIPREVAFELFAMIHNEDSNVEIQISRDDVEITAGSRAMYFEPIDDRYPEYHRVVPKKNGHGIVLTKSELLEAIDEVLPVGQHPRYLKFLIQDKRVVVSCPNTKSKVTKSVALNARFEAPLTLAASFNARYVLDVLKNIASVDFNINFSEGGVSVALFEGFASNDASYVLMPLRI